MRMLAPALLLVVACGRGHHAASGRPAVDEERARTSFLAVARVLQHPRCLNCHPSGDAPLRGMDAGAHEPPVVRGDSGRGVAGLRCVGCHQDTNLALARVPGAPGWRLAPRSMGWQGLSPAALCAQLQDLARNGGKSLTELHAHMAHDPLVAWGFAPGADREPAPGTQAELAAHVAAWIAAGAACPTEETR